jgi:putative copper resistance protein D
VIHFGFVLTRSVHFAAALLMLGVWLFDRLVATAIGPSLAWRKISARLIGIPLPIAALSAVAWLGCLSISINDDVPPRSALAWPTLKAILNETQFGVVWKLRAGMWLGCCVLSLLIFRSKSSRLIWAWLAILCSAGFVGSLAWAGHGQTGPHMMLHLSSDVIHLLATAAWPMGLLPFAMLLCSVRRSSNALLQARLTNRFSSISFWTVMILLASGIVNSWILVGSLNNLFHTPYGQTLTRKIVIFGFMVVFGAVNSIWLKPRLPASSAASRWLQWNVAIELSLTVAVIVIVGVLGLQPPPVEFSP